MRQFVLYRLMLDPQLGERPAHLLVLRLKAGHSANQSANQAGELGRRHALKRITGINGNIPSLNHELPTLDSPFRPEFAPITDCEPNPSISLASLEERGTKSGDFG